MTNAVIYARYSSHGQQEQSIDGQLRVCRQYANTKNLNIVEIYIDRAKTGTSAINRLEFQRMIEDAGKGLFCCVIVYQFDRFARSRYDSIIYKTLLKKHGVRVISAMEPSTDSPDSIIVEGLLESMAEYYSADLSMKARRGIKESIIKKQTIGGRQILGYKTENKRIVIDDSTATIVKEIFKLYSQGESITNIVKNLNNLGYRTNKGNQFSKSSLQHMLSNRKYIGEFYFRGELVDDYYPALISKEVFMKVQVIKDSNKHSGSKFSSVNRKYPLSNVLHCGQCGSIMTGTSGNGRNKTYYYYKCSNGDCISKNVRAEDLENKVFNELRTFMSKDANINRLTDLILKSISMQSDSKNIKKYKNMLKDIDNQLSKISDAFIDANSDTRTLLNIKISSLSEAKRTINNQIVKETKINNLHPDKTTIREWLKGIDFSVEVGNDKIVNDFCKAIYHFNDMLVLYLNTDNEQITYEKALADYNANAIIGSTEDEIGRGGGNRTPNNGFGDRCYTV